MASVPRRPSGASFPAKLVHMLGIGQDSRVHADLQSFHYPSCPGLVCSVLLLLLLLLLLILLLLLLLLILLLLLLLLLSLPWLPVRSVHTMVEICWRRTFYITCINCVFFGGGGNAANLGNSITVTSNKKYIFGDRRNG